MYSAHHQQTKILFVVSLQFVPLNSLGRKGGPISSRHFHATVDLNFRLTSHEPPSAVAALIVATIAIAIAGVLAYKSVRCTRAACNGPL